MKKIVVIGSSNTDLVIKTERIPSPGETVLGGTFLMTAGGKGANQAVAVARLGGDVAFIARVGHDMFGEQAIKGYAADNLDTSDIIIDTTSPTGVALITVDAKGENCIVVAPGANNALNCEDIEASADKIREAEYLLTQLEIPMEVVEAAVRVADANGTKAIINPAPAAEISDEILAKLYMITPNRTEGQLLTGVAIEDWDGAEKAADILLARGVKNVVITLGSLGAFVKNAQFSERIPALKVKAVDTTAAGDVFNGALCVALAEGETLVDAVKFATRASAIAVTRMGAQASIPYRKEMN